MSAFADAGRKLDVSLEGGAAALPGAGRAGRPARHYTHRRERRAPGPPLPEALMSSKPGAGIYLCRNQIVAASRLNHGIHAIDATPARWRTPDSLVDFHTGINHKEFGVTSEGVAVFVGSTALREVGIDARKDAFGCRSSVGPTATSRATSSRSCNATGRRRARRRRGGRHAVRPAPHGLAIDARIEGLDGNELRRLVEASAPIASFDRSCWASRHAPDGGRRRRRGAA